MNTPSDALTTPPVNGHHRLRPNNPAPAPERIPPHALDAEQGVLGCLLMWPQECVDACVERGVVRDWFYDPRHQIILSAVQEVFGERGTLDLVLMVDYLTLKEELEVIGGYPYLTTLMDQVPSSANLAYYLDVLEDAWQSRRLLRFAAEAREAAYQREGIHDAIQKLCSQMIGLAMGAGKDHGQPIQALLPPIIERLETYTRGRAQITGQVTTGFEYLDKLLCGLGGDQNGNLYVISGRPGMGKTSLALQIAVQCATAKENPVPVAIFSMEMNAGALCYRTLFQTARADMQRFRTGFAEAEMPALAAAMESLAAAKIYVDDERRMNIDTLRSRARRYYRAHGCRLFVVDYIQLMRSGRSGRRDDRVQELSDISAGLQAIAWELNCPFLCIAQMNRDYEKETRPRKPRLSDLKDCGAIEQDADVVWMLYRPAVNKDDKLERVLDKASIDPRSGKPDWSKRLSQVHMIIAKNRYGPADKHVEFAYRGSSTSFEDLYVWAKSRGVDPSAEDEAESKPKTQEEHLEEASRDVFGIK